MLGKRKTALTRIHRKEVAEPTGQGMRGESKRR